MEIDEYRDYDKAVGALKEALKYLRKSETRTGAEMAEHMEDRIALIVKFIEAKSFGKKESDQMISICRALLNESHIEEALRAGDVIALLVEHYHSIGEMNEAYKCIEQLEDRRIVVAPFIDAEILNDVYKAVGGKGDKQRRGSGQESKREEEKSRATGQGQQSDDEEELDEEIDEVCVLCVFICCVLIAVWRWWRRRRSR